MLEDGLKVGIHLLLIIHKVFAESQIIPRGPLPSPEWMDFVIKIH